MTQKTVEQKTGSLKSVMRVSLFVCSDDNIQPHTHAHTHPEATAAPKHTSACIHTEVTCVPADRCE